MCGIAGIYAYHESAVPVNKSELLRIREHMLKRGPDDAGLWIANDGRVGLANRRLAILDLSNAAAQPMTTSDGRFHITFNGEIYNYRELRKGLETKGRVFRSQSDTEVLLHLYAVYGADMLQRLRGMFAFAIWDEREKTLFLARDPFGIKPLYYSDDGLNLRFASQVKALLAGGAVDNAPESAGTVGFMLWGYVPEPFTMYRGIQALPAGCYLTLKGGAPPRLVIWFSVRDELVQAQERARPFQMADREALAELLRDSVQHHLIADVPVCAFLSSGVDSTLVSALAVEKAGVALRTFTLGFEEYHGTVNDEVPLAEHFAVTRGISHETRWIRRSDFEQEINAILAAMDQPTIDGVNMYFVCREAARAGMKVALSGLGGDELFSGYPSFHDIPRSVRWLRPVRYIPYLGRLVRSLITLFLPKYMSPKYASLLEYGGTYAGAYLLRRGLFMPWELSEVLDPVAIHTGLERLQALPMISDSIQGLHEPHAKVAVLELTWYLRNQLLRDTDWAGMAHSLEVRTPFVDVTLFRKLAPWLVAEPAPTKMDASTVLRAYLNVDVLERGKSGFSVPVREWLESAGTAHITANRGLRGWARRLLPQQPKQFRALMLVTDAFGGYGGIAKFNRDFITGLAAMPECAEVIVMPRLFIDQHDSLPARITHLAAAAGGKLNFVITAFLKGLRGPCNIVIAGHINLVWLGVVLALLCKARSALIIHGIDAWSPHRSWLVRETLPYVDYVIGVSKLTLERFGKWTHADRDRFRLLPNCIDLARFTPGPKPADLVRQLGLDGRTVIMTFGRLASEERYKGFDEVIEALPELARKVPNIGYLICGDGPDRARLEEKAHSLGVGDRVVFAGFVPESRKVEYYRLADAYVMPSRGEGFGIVLLEAMACGVPVLGSTADGSREALLEGELGELVDPANSRDIIAGIIKSLARGKSVPDKLQIYSTREFQDRVQGIVSEVVACQ